MIGKFGDFTYESLIGAVLGYWRLPLAIRIAMWVLALRKNFLDCSRYRKQKSGRATADLQVTRTKCGRELQGDSRIEFARDGLVCACCFDGKAKSP